MFLTFRLHSVLGLSRYSLFPCGRGRLDGFGAVPVVAETESPDAYFIIALKIEQRAAGLRRRSVAYLACETYSMWVYWSVGVESLHAESISPPLLSGAKLYLL